MEFSNPVLLAYVPVLHEGYLRWFRSHTEACFLFLVPPSLLGTERWIAKEIRALSISDVLRSLQGFRDIPETLVLTTLDLPILREKNPTIVIPNDSDMRRFASEHLNGVTIQWEDVFLRWDRRRVEGESAINVDSVVSEDCVRVFMERAYGEASRSPDFWIHVGAVAVRDNTVLLSAYNTHLPSEHTVYVAGDPRAFYTRGIRTDLSCADHAERVLIGRAARDGLSLNGADLYITTFPCPSCAYQIVDAGFRSVCFSEGYSLLDAELILKQAGVCIVRIVSEKNNPSST